MDELFVIAEAGVNHDGSVDVALDMVDVAAAAGADAIKFQTFRADDLATRTAPKAEYQTRTVKDVSQQEMLRRLELDADAHARIAARCLEQKIEFMSTPFDPESVELLQRIGVRRYKIPSGELTNPLLLRAVAKTRCPLILSTGMATLDEIGRSLEVLRTAGVPVEERVTVLQCTTEYPAPASSANLRVIPALRAAFGVRVGYSDHTLGTSIALAAVALGATVVEKHFTLDTKRAGPDHAASLPAEELEIFVRSLREVSRALGDGVKAPSAVELPNRAIARRSIVARKAIRAGETFTAENLTLKRPGTGISAERWDDVIGQVARRDYAIDDLIE